MSKPECRLFSLLVSSIAAIALFASCGVNTHAVSPTNPGVGGTTAATCPSPGSGPAIGSGHLAVSDWQNDRVLIFNGPFTTGECASVVLGQSNFDSEAVLPSEGSSILMGPAGLAVDASGNLYVADYNGGRIMQFQQPFTNGMDASLELGKPNFRSMEDFNGLCAYATSAMSLCMPNGVAVDSAGDVWVADTWEGRIVEHQPPIKQSMGSSIAIGQPDINQAANCDGVYSIFRDNTGAPATTTASEFCDPMAAVLDEHGNLWVADAANDRVLEFIPPFSTGMSASLEIGFPSSVGMSSPTPFADDWTCPPSGYLCGPGTLAFDSEGNLWVSDSGNNRILEFSPPFSSGMAASLVIGQSDFTSTGLKPTASNTLNDPNGLSFDANDDLIVADWLNNRILIFSPPFSNGMSASVVIGQPNMTSGTARGCEGKTGETSQSGPTDGSAFCHPDGVLAF